jgi:hypothetical protein
LVRDPFQAYSHENDFSLSKKEHLIELSSASGLKIQFCDLGFSRFWISHSVRSEFPELSEEALKTVMRFQQPIFVTGARGSVVGWDTMLQAGSLPVQVSDEVDFFNLPNSSSRTMALGSTQPLTKMSTRNLPGSEKRSAHRADNLAAIYEPNV